MYLHDYIHVYVLDDYLHTTKACMNLAYAYPRLIEDQCRGGRDENRGVHATYLYFKGGLSRLWQLCHTY